MAAWTPAREAAALALVEQRMARGPLYTEPFMVELEDCIAALQAEREARQAAEKRMVELAVENARLDTAVAELQLRVPYDGEDDDES